MTTFEPGARLVFTHGLRWRPRSTAFFASRPAPTITGGFDVFVQLVIAAITTRAVLSSIVAVDCAPCAVRCVATVDRRRLRLDASARLLVAVGSLAGNESATPLSSVPLP